MTPYFFSHNHYCQIHTAIISVSVNYSAEILIHADTVSQSIHSLGGETGSTLAMFRASVITRISLWFGILSLKEDVSLLAVKLWS